MIWVVRNLKSWLVFLPAMSSAANLATCQFAFVTAQRIKDDDLVSWIDKQLFGCGGFPAARHTNHIDMMITQRIILVDRL